MAELLRIFYADPDLEMVGRMRPALAAADMALAGSAQTAHAGLPEIAAQRPDVVVLDDSACTGTPAEVVRRIAAASPATVVIVTGGTGTSPSTMGRAVAAGARGFLLKPYAAEELIALVREATSSRQRDQAPSAKTPAPRPPPPPSAASASAASTRTRSSTRTTTQVHSRIRQRQFGARRSTPSSAAARSPARPTRTSSRSGCPTEPTIPARTISGLAGDG